MLLVLAAAAAGQDGTRKTGIAKGVAFLRAKQRPDGSWGGTVAGPLAWGTGLNLYALAAAGVPADDPAVTRALAWIDRHPDEVDYGANNGVKAASMLVLALARLDRARFAGRIETLTERLVRSQKDRGLWDFPLGRFSTKDGKPSGTVAMGRGYGTHTMVAVHALTEAGGRVPARTWKRVQRYHEQKQSASGGWREFSSLRHDGSTLTAGTLANYLAAGGKADSRVAKRGLKAMRRKRDDLARTCVPPFLFMVIRAARAADLPAADWDAPAVRLLLANQRPDGSWGLRGRRGVVSHDGLTAYAVLALAHAR